MTVYYPHRIFVASMKINRPNCDAWW